MKPALILMILLPILGCASMSPPPAEPLDPPAIYQTHFARVEECSRIGGSFDEIEWFVVEPDDWEGERLNGLWLRPDQIYIDRLRLAAPRVVRHEILHFLLQSGDHPEDYFGDPDSGSPGLCGPLVTGSL